MSKQLVSGKHRLRNTYWSLVGAVSAMILSVQPVMAETIWDRFSTIMRDIYGQLVGISTIVAVTVAAIALLVRMVSRNQRAVDEATSWLKRVVVTWIILNTLGFMEKLITRKEAAKILGISIATLDAARQNGLISYVQYVPNGCVYFTDAALQEYVAKCTKRAKPADNNLTYRKQHRPKKK